MYNFYTIFITYSSATFQVNGNKLWLLTIHLRLDNIQVWCTLMLNYLNKVLHIWALICHHYIVQIYQSHFTKLKETKIYPMNTDTVSMTYATLILYHKAKLSKLITPLLIFTIQHPYRRTFRMYYYFTFRNDKLFTLYFTFCNLNFKWRKVISSFYCHTSSE